MTQTRPARPAQRTLAALLLLVLVTSCSDAPQSSGPDGVPPEVAQYADDWPLPGRDYLNSRATFDSTIAVERRDARARVAGDLHRAWRVRQPVDDAAHRGRYDLPAGPLEPRHRARSRDSARRAGRRRSVVALRPERRGAGLGQGVRERRHVGHRRGGRRDRWLLLVAQLTVTASDGVDIQPVAYGDLVFASTVPVSAAGPKGGDRGVLYALRRDTGEVAWSFDTVDSGGPVGPS